MSDDENPTGGHHQPNSDDADNSIIEKVRSRVSSILPQSISKWFSPTTAADGRNVGINSNNRNRRRRNEISERTQIGDRQADTGQYTDDSDEEVAEEGANAPQAKRVRLNNAEEHTELLSKTTKFEASRKLLSTPTTSNRRRYINLPSNEPRPAPYDFTSSLSTPYFPSTLIGSTRIEQSEVRALHDETDDTGEVDVLEVIPQYISSPSTASRRRLNIPSTSDTRPISTFHTRHTLPSKGYNLPNLKRPSISPNRVMRNVELEEEGNEDLESNTDEQQINSNNNNSKRSKPEENILTNGIRSSRHPAAADTASESGESQCSSFNTNKIYEFGQGPKLYRSSASSGLNFATNLQGEKSLFSDKNMPKTLNNSTTSLTSLYRRQSFNPSLYGSTSALSDSRLLNTSSPFYKGRTTYGGASAYTKYAPIKGIELKQTDQSSPGLSNAAKRVLHILNSFSSPLEDARKMASSSSKRHSDLQARLIHNSIRKRFSQIPYNRPSSAMATSPTSLPKNELTVPSKVKLLQMKNLQASTEKVRDIVNSPRSEQKSGQGEFSRHAGFGASSNEYQLPDTGKISGRRPLKQVKKVKSKVNTARASKAGLEDEETVPPVNLPEISFPAMKSVPKIDLDSSTPKVSATDKPVSSFEKSTPTITVTGPPEEKGKDESEKPGMNFLAATNNQQGSTFKFTSIVLPNHGSSFNFNLNKESTTKTPAALTSSLVNSVKSSANDTSAKGNLEFKFSHPIVINNANTNCSKEQSVGQPPIEFKFSEPIIVNKLESSTSVKLNFSSTTQSVSKVTTNPKAPSTMYTLPTVPQLKTGSVLDALKKPVATTVTNTSKSESKSDSKEEVKEDSKNTKETKTSVSSTVDFKAIVSQQASKWGCESCLTRNEQSVEKCVCCENPKPGPLIKSAGSVPLLGAQALPAKPSGGMDDGFKKIAAAQQSSKWECTSCLTRNDESQNKCVCCEQAKPGAVLDTGFKSLVTQQSAKWECTTCLTRNEPGRSKCVCCEQSKPGTVKENAPSFSFGSQTSKFSFGFGKQGEQAMKADATNAKEASTSKTESNTTTAATSGTTTNTSTTVPITFGINPIAAPAKDVTDASTGKTASETKSTTDPPKPAIGFTFGTKPATTATTSTTTTTETGKKDASPATFTFGAKPAAAAPKEETKPNTPMSSFKFGAPTKATPENKANEETKETKPAEKPTGRPSVFTRLGGFQASPIKAPEKTPFAFTPSTTSSTSTKTQKSEVSTTSNAPDPKKLFAFGAKSSDASKNDKEKSFGFGFGTQSSTTTASPLATSSFGSSAFGSKLNAAPTTTVSFGSTTTSTTTTTASNLFVFGKPTTSTSVTPSFGAISSNTITSTNQATASTTASSFGTLGSTVSSTSTATFGADKPATVLPAAVNPPTFGSPATTQQSNLWNTFGASTSQQQQPQQSKPVFTFGAAASKTESTPTFGSVSSTTSKPFVFGSGATNNNATTTTNSTFGGFGAIAPKPSTAVFGSATTGTTSSPFGAPAPVANVGNQPATVFGQPSAVVSPFGSNNNTPAFGSVQSPASNSIFGAPAPTPSFGSTPTFGSPAVTPAPVFENSPSTSAFGVRSNPFGGSDDPAAKKTSTGFSFGSPAQNQTGFAFGANNNNSNNNNNNNDNTKTGFNFTPGAPPNFNFSSKQETSSGNFNKSTSPTKTKSGTTTHSAVGLMLKNWLKPKVRPRTATTTNKSDEITSTTESETSSSTLSTLPSTQQNENVKQDDQTETKQTHANLDSVDNKRMTGNERGINKRSSKNFLTLRNNKKIYRFPNDVTSRKISTKLSPSAYRKTSKALINATSTASSTELPSKSKLSLRNYSKFNRYKLIRRNSATPTSTANSNSDKDNTKNNNNDNKNNNSEKNLVPIESTVSDKAQDLQEVIKRKTRFAITNVPPSARSLRSFGSLPKATGISKHAMKVKKKYYHSKYKYVRPSE